VAPPLEHLAEQLLAAAGAAVDVGGVDEDDALLKGRVDDGACPVEVEPTAEVVGAEPDDRHLEVGVADPAEFACHARRVWTGGLGARRAGLLAVLVTLVSL